LPGRRQAAAGTRPFPFKSPQPQCGWRLLHRRLSISAPRMIERSHLPLRWVLGALSLGFSTAVALWAFEFGKGIAVLDRQSNDEQAHQIEAENLALEADLEFFQRPLPTAVARGLTVRALQAELKAPAQTRYYLLVTQDGNDASDLAGRYEIVLSGTLKGRAWSFRASRGTKSLSVCQYARVKGDIEHPEQAMVKTVQARVTDHKVQLVATQSVKS
jgi:hypothetical protein